MIPLTPRDDTRPVQLVGPAPLYVRLDDNVRITVYNAAAGVTITARARVLGCDGDIDDAVESFVPNTTRVAATQLMRTDEGWILGGEVFAAAGSPALGQTYVVVEIVRGDGAAAIALDVLATGYVTSKQPLRFPAVTFGASLDAAGALRSIAGTTPGAGVDISETVPTGARWELLAFQATLTTSATVANRIPVLVLDDGAAEFERAPVGGNITASNAARATWAQGLPRFNDLSFSAIASGFGVNMRLAAASRMRTLTAGLQVGDQWSAVQYLVREWIEGAS